MTADRQTPQQPRTPSELQLDAADDARWRAVMERDRSAELVFVYAVATTGIYCRPTGPSRRPRRENARFFDSWLQAEEAGYRSCRHGCLTLADFYGDEQAAQVRRLLTPRLAEAAGRDLVILTRDGNLYVNEHGRLVLEGYRHRVFWIGPKEGTGQDWADTFEAHHRAIVRYARRPWPVRRQGPAARTRAGLAVIPGGGPATEPASDPVSDL